jgi:hypothetical protein
MSEGMTWRPSPGEMESHERFEEMRRRRDAYWDCVSAENPVEPSACQKELEALRAACDAVGGRFGSWGACSGLDGFMTSTCVLLCPDGTAVEMVVHALLHGSQNVLACPLIPGEEKAELCSCEDPAIVACGLCTPWRPSR